VAGVWPAFGAAHDATVEIATSRVIAEPRADSLFGWNISTTFHIELIAISNCRRPTSLEAEFRGQHCSEETGGRKRTEDAAGGRGSMFTGETHRAIDQKGTFRLLNLRPC
jgi:hypothetical protein